MQVFYQKNFIFHFKNSQKPAKPKYYLDFAGSYCRYNIKLAHISLKSQLTVTAIQAATYSLHNT